MNKQTTTEIPPKLTAESLPDISLSPSESRREQIRGLWFKIRRYAVKPLHWLSRISANIRRKLRTLNFSQWCYLVAIVMLMGFLSEEQPDDDYQMVVGLIAGFGLVRELWKVFTKVWEHTLGKGVLFVLYAATANFALAISALKINSITGVEPQIFIFTMGFTTLLMLPFWLLLASMVFLGSALLLMNLWLLVSLLLRLVRIRLPIHWEDQSFAVLTMLFRIMLIPFLFVVISFLMTPYIKQLDMFVPLDEITFFEKVDPVLVNPQYFKDSSDDEMRDFFNRLRKGDQEQVAKGMSAEIQKYQLTEFQVNILQNMSTNTMERLIRTIRNSSEPVKLVQFRASVEDSQDSIGVKVGSEVEGLQMELVLDDNEGDSSQASVEQSSDENTAENSGLLEELVPDDEVEELQESAEESAEENSRLLDLMVANFIYTFEMYPSSICRKADYQRAMKLDENLVFLAQKDYAREVGYRFSVADCKPNYHTSKGEQP